jgi:antitoxin CcdA
VLAEARRLGINISQACDDFLRELVHKERARCWKEDNAGFIAEYNRIVEAEGLPLAQWRSF